MNDLEQSIDEDPWSLPLEERRCLLEVMSQAQDNWLPLLNKFVEPPALNDDFPAFLLETAMFSELRDAIASQILGQPQPRVLDTATADTLQHFVDLFRHYMTEVNQRDYVSS